MNDEPSPLTLSLLALILSHQTDGWTGGLWLVLSIAAGLVYLGGKLMDWKRRKRWRAEFTNGDGVTFVWTDGGDGRTT